MSKPIALVITCFNEHKRAGKLLRACEIAFTDPRIGELVLQDDSANQEAWDYFATMCAEIKSKLPSRVKFTAHVNEVNCGVFGNKLASIRHAELEWVQSIDSDNHFGVEYLNVLGLIEWLPHLMISPSFAAPEFDYREQAGKKITLSNIASLMEWNRFSCLMNTGNQFFHQRTMLKVFDGQQIQHFQMDQPDYYDVGPARAEHKWRAVFDSADSFYFNKRWLLSGNEIFVAPGLTYQHEVHPGSSWQAAPAEKDLLPIIYSLELADAGRGEKADYFIEGAGTAGAVSPPLSVPPSTRVVVLRRQCNGRRWRMWVGVAEPRVLKSVNF